MEFAIINKSGDKLTSAQAQDEILRHILKNKELGYFNHGKIRNQLFPELNREQTELLFDNLIDHYDDITKHFKTDLGASICSNGLTQSFLENGGFVKIEEENTIDIRKSEEGEKRAVDIQELDIKTKRRQKYAFWPLFIMTIISGILSLWVASNGDEDSTSHTYKKIEQLENRLIQLESKLIEEKMEIPEQTIPIDSINIK